MNFIKKLREVFQRREDITELIDTELSKIMDTPPEVKNPEYIATKTISEADFEALIELIKFGSNMLDSNGDGIRKDKILRYRTDAETILVKLGRKEV